MMRFVISGWPAVVVMKRFARIAVCALLVCVLSAVVPAQQSAPPPVSGSTQSEPPQSRPRQSSPNTQQPQQKAQAPATTQDVLKQEEKQRALGVVPLFGMTSVRNAPPLSSREKFQLMVKSLIDPFTFVDAGITAGIGQADNSFPAYGQGAEGFGKRYGAALADGDDSAFFSNFVYPVLFKQDPRYFRVGEGSVKKRTLAAMEQEFVARQDSGRHNFHFSNVLGAFTAGTISNAYYPKADRGVGLTASRAAIALGYGSLGNIFLEFWPDIDRKLFHKQQNEAHPSEPPGTPPK